MPHKKIKKSSTITMLWKKLGPGLITGASDDDPSGIATYSQAGAKYGFQLLWMSVLTLPLMIVVQEMCARIGMVTGQGLATNIRKYYPRPILIAVVFLLFSVNTFNIAADLSAMAAGVQLFFPKINVLLVILFWVLVSSLLQVFIPYKNYSKYLKYLSLVLIAYPATLFFIHANIKEVLSATFLPSITFSKDQIFIICAILGTTISPYLFFWQTSQEVEEKIEMKKKTLQKSFGTSRKSILWMDFDVTVGMCVANFTMFCIMLVCGATLFRHGVTDIKDAAQAASALKPFAGPWAQFLFSLGILGTGLLTIPVLAGSSAYAIAEIFHLNEGLYKKFKDASGFYIIILLGMVVAFILTVFKLDPIKALIYAAVANSVITPPVLFFIVRIANNPSVMGKKYHSFLSVCFGWIIIGIMTAAALAVLIGWLF